jgi:hypothetical protein
MVRYDPTREEHKIFEIKNVPIESTILTKKVEDEKMLSDDNDDQQEVEEKKVEEETSKFYEIRDDIKNLFCKNEVFKFKFTKSSDEEEEVEELEQKEISDDERNFKNYSKIKRSLDYMNNTDNNNYESSLSSDDDNRREPNEVLSRFKKIDNIDQSTDFIPDINEPRLQGTFLKLINSTFLKFIYSCLFRSLKIFCSY